MSKEIVKTGKTLAEYEAMLKNAVDMWANATTDAESRRRADHLRDKSKAVSDFFRFVEIGPEQVQPDDIKAWIDHLEGKGLAPASVYAMVSRISSFYNWARRDSGLAGVLTFNPVDLARPKPAKAYQSDRVKSLDDEELNSLQAVIKVKAETGSLVGLRDYALFVHFLATGRRRAEVIGLRWGDVKLNSGMIVTYRVKGGDVETYYIEDESVKDSMIAYLEASGRLESMNEEDPIWTRHDRAGNPGNQVTSHAIAKNFKRYAKEAGIKDFHLHQLRHSVGRIASEVLGNVADVQHILGHKSPATTKIYIQRVGVRRSKISSIMADRFGFGS